MEAATFLTLSLRRLERLTLPVIAMPLQVSRTGVNRALVTFGIQYYTYASIAHVRRVLRGVLQVSDDANWASANILARHLFEWAAQASFVGLKMPSLFRSARWGKAWEILLKINGGDLFFRRFGGRYLDTGSAAREMPEPFKVADFIAVYSSIQRTEDGAEDAPEDYSLLSELSHPSAACLRQHLEFHHDQIRFSGVAGDCSPFELVSVSVLDWMLSVAGLLDLIQDASVGPQIREALTEISEVPPSRADTP